MEINMVAMRTKLVIVKWQCLYLVTSVYVT
jgi:hypothetical protein